MKEPKPSLAATLNFLKHIHNATNQDIVDRSGLSESTIRRMLNGKLTNPTFYEICCVADAFKVPVDYFRNIRAKFIVWPDEFDVVTNYRSVPVDFQADIQRYIKEKCELYRAQIRSHSEYGIRTRFREETDKLPVTDILKLMKALTDGTLQDRYAEDHEE